MRMCEIPHHRHAYMHAMPFRRGFACISIAIPASRLRLLEEEQISSQMHVARYTVLF